MIDVIIGGAVEVLHHADRDPRPSRATVSRIVEAASIPPAGWGLFAACVEERESGGNPSVVNASGHAGLFQFSTDWRHGLRFVLARGLKAHGMTPGHARWVREHLPTRIEAWPAAYQRAAFAQVIAEGGRVAALRHWILDGSRCNGLVPAGA